MDAIFDALASAARRRILLYLADDDLTAGEIAARFDMSKPAISKHLQILENAGLVGSRKQGQFVHYWLVRGRLVATLEGFLQRIDPPSPPPAETGVESMAFDDVNARRGRHEYIPCMRTVSGRAPSTSLTHPTTKCWRAWFRNWAMEHPHAIASDRACTSHAARVL